MHKIVALWAVPRSTSTAFEWMMRQRGDLDCLHEPFGEAWYQGEAPLWHRFQPGEVTTPGLTLDSVWKDIRSRADNCPVFLKDFPHYVSHMWDAEFLSHFNHAFLIRDPAKTVTSMYDKWPDFHEGEVGFPEQRALFDLLWALAGSPPPVIDSDDLLERPHQMVEAFCSAVGIPFIEDALSWEPGGDPSAHSWWDGGSFHANLARSTGLSPQDRRYIEIEDQSPRVQQVYRRMKPHYDRLYQHRIVL
ncbi:sulfotransferase family protein [Alisedimentitalea sp. MJ-SS2]|uniref:sulfotransferase-like domain-containing protein n=1 Tax=Aliisedimentitalea sp. MJ-SS2 TaxID=3049795 RepID=UPI00290F2925|nr:sulfotransferase family protein [Alisedimentitalea sp. MJ-SS2]MDU8927213.1 sulfotransferase family protein [Alisedimentitalea sp. MJ-SS2]